MCYLCICHKTSGPGSFGDIFLGVRICSYFDREPLAYIPPYISCSKVFHRTLGLSVSLLQERNIICLLFVNIFLWLIFQPISVKILHGIYSDHRKCSKKLSVITLWFLVPKISRHSINILWINESDLQLFITKQKEKHSWCTIRS